MNPWSPDIFHDPVVCGPRDVSVLCAGGPCRGDCGACSAARVWEEAVRKRFGYYDVLFTPDLNVEIPDKPPGPLARSRKRTYGFILKELPSCG
jgi:hypothetical protein